MSTDVQAEPALSDLSEEERRARFDRLQQRLVPTWQAMRMNRPGESLVVVPSITPDDSSTPGALVQTYEERMLFLLLLLRQPRLQMVFVTSPPVDERIIDYYLSLLPGVIPSHARARAAPRGRGRRIGPPTRRQAAGAPARSRGDPRPHPRRRALPPRSLHDVDARA